jgi:hypothetical protein
VRGFATSLKRRAIVRTPNVRKSEARRAIPKLRT